MTFQHYSVLLNETIEQLDIKENGIYVDGTLGGGGHASAVLQRLGETGRLIGIDQDAAAIEAAGERLAPFGDKVTIVRCFEDDNIIHVDGSVDPARDIETINLELIFSDIEILERRIAKIAKQAKMDKAYAKELELAQAVKAHLEDGKMARTFEVSDDEDEQIWFKNYNLLTAKPTIYAANVAEDDLADDGASNPHVAKVREMAKEEGAEVFVICAQIEQELADLDDDEKKEYLEDLGVSSSGLDKLVAASYSLLGLISFLTAGEEECRAWTIKKGTKAPQAAGKIHTDFERGFIKAEVVNYQDLLDNGSLSAAKEKGIVGMEGKEYVVKDGDVILFRFNV